MPRVNHVAKARKAQGNCGKCGTPIKQGDPYKWIKFRYGGKRIICGKCQFRDGDLTQGKLGTVYSARDSALEEVKNWAPDDGADALKDIATTAAEEIKTVAEEYRESAENIREHFSESSTADECEDKADQLEEYADEIEGVDVDDFDEDEVKREAGEEYEEEHPKPKNEDKIPAWEEKRDDYIEEQLQEKLNEWGEEARSVIEEALGNCPL